MGVYSTLEEPGRITTNPEKIKLFNEIAEVLENRETFDNLPEETQNTLTNLARIAFHHNKVTFKNLEHDSSRSHFQYRLDEEGWLKVTEWTTKHYADFLLAGLLALTADHPIYLKFTSEEGSISGYKIDPKNQTIKDIEYLTIPDTDIKDTIVLAMHTASEFAPKLSPEECLNAVEVKTFVSIEEAEQWIKEQQEKTDTTIEYRIIPTRKYVYAND